MSFNGTHPLWATFHSPQTPPPTMYTYKIEDVGGSTESYATFEEAYARFINLRELRFHVRLYKVGEELLYEA